MSFFYLVIRNVWSKKARSIGLTLAVAFAVMTVVTLGVTSSGLEQSAAAIISVGKADFTVVQKGVADTLSSTIDTQELALLRQTPGVSSVTGVLVEIEHINANNPVFIEIGIKPSDFPGFGVRIVSGQAFAPTAAHEVMLGWRAAANLGLHVGDRFHANGTWNTVTGIYSTGNSFGDAGAMFPLPAIQGYNRVAGIVTLAFVKVSSGTSAAATARHIDYAQPELTTIRTAAQFGRADRDLVYLQAAVNGSTVLAILIGAVIVGNTMLLSLFERMHEFGLMRAVGWTRRRMVTLLLGESLLLAFIGAAVGVVLSFAVAAILSHLPALKGILHPNFTEGVFWRALYTALGMTLVGALYPTTRAALLSPLKALSYE
ncbi:MAG TPA: FtsX-like permease family protein [Acidimicrobiales bacterium]|nr:FtsX-like permease family protein [Acidimicrobiales bacterium]